MYKRVISIHSYVSTIISSIAEQKLLSNLHRISCPEERILFTFPPHNRRFPALLRHMSLLLLVFFLITGNPVSNRFFFSVTRDSQHDCRNTLVRCSPDTFFSPHGPFQAVLKLKLNHFHLRKTLNF